MATLWNIKFSNLNTTTDKGYFSAAGKFTDSSNLTDGVYTADGQGSTPSFSVNAVDIDWNGAEVGSSTIDNTGQLLKIIADLQTKVSQLETAFSTLASNVGSLVTITNGE